MTKWINCLKEYNRNQRVWCVPKKGSRSYDKIMKCVKGDKNAFDKKKKFKIVEKFEDEEPRDIQDNPDLVTQMKRATINDVPEDVMNHIMGKYLGVADKAKLATVGVKVKMTDEEAKEADLNLSKYNTYMEVIDKVREIFSKRSVLTSMLYNMFKNKKTPKENDNRFAYYKYKMVEDYTDDILRFVNYEFINGFKMGRTNKINVYISLDENEGKFNVRKSYGSLKKYGKLESFYTNNEIYKLMKLPKLSKKIQEKHIKEFNKQFNVLNNNYKYYVNLIKVINKNILNTDYLNKVFRYAVIYDAVKKNYVKPGIKLSYDVDKINKKILNLDNLYNIYWNNLITTARDPIAIFRDGEFALNNKKSEEYNRIEYGKYDYPLIFNLNHKTNPFTEKDFIKMENDVKIIRNNLKDTDGYGGVRTITEYKKYIDNGLNVLMLSNTFDKNKIYDYYSKDFIRP